MFFKFIRMGTEEKMGGKVWGIVGLGCEGGGRPFGFGGKFLFVLKLGLFDGRI